VLYPNKKPVLSGERGFTLVELMIVVGIFTVISAVMLMNYPGFSHRISLQNLAHLIALEVRQAQVYGLSVRESSPGSEIFAPHGIYFTAADRGSFVLFVDTVPLSGNNKYDGSLNCDLSAECLERLIIGNGDRIKDICAVASGGSEVCASSGGVDTLNIVFTRPDPDALITINGVETLYQSARIKIEPPKRDFEKTIVVSVTGQISIQ